MIDARCSCGAVALSLPGPTNRVATCHCIECQRRTGAPFGVAAFYPGRGRHHLWNIKGVRSRSRQRRQGPFLFLPGVRLDGLLEARQSAGNDWRCHRHDRGFEFPGPIKSVFEQSKHAWVEINGADIEHLQQGSARKT